MPNVLDPNAGMNIDPAKGKDLSQIDHGYDYPDGLNLRPGTKKHDLLVSQIMRFATDSHTQMSQRHKDWREIDRVLKSYTYLPSTGGTSKKSKDEHNEQNDESRRIIMPVSSVVLDTLLTYMTSAFLRPPIFQYEGTGPEDILGAMLLTEVVQKQVHRNAVPLSLHTAWRDMFAYGVGYASPRWKVEHGRTTQLQSVGVLDSLRALFLETGKERTTSGYEILYEGNALDNIDPYLALPDPTVSAHEVQDGEFFGWIDEEVLSSLMRNEESNGYFNVKYLKDLNGKLTSIIRNRGDRNRRPQQFTASSNPVDILWMYVDLIPRDWKLGRGDVPETWVFGIAADKIIIKAEPLNLTHGKIPVVSGSPDFDGYSSTPLSRLMAIEEVQMLVDFLYTSHVENIRRVINDNLVVDPSLINIHDLNNNKPGKIIRARKRAWGSGGLRDNAIFQLDVKDATQGNVSDAIFLMEQAKQATSTMDALGGSLAPRTSRISANEAQGTRLAGLSRLERPAQIISYQFMQPIARMFASNVQQFMSQETYIKATGDLAEVLANDFGIEIERDRVHVGPLDLVVNYDIEAHDGATPGKEDPQAWIELFQSLGQNPQLAQNFDMLRIFKHVARQLGAKNVDKFVRQGKPEVMSDEDVLREADRGNIIPSGENNAI